VSSRSDEPLVGAHVILEKLPSTFVSDTVTNNDGDYYFENIEAGSYRVLVDIPGLGMDSSHTVNVVVGTNDYPGLDYEVDSTQGIMAVQGTSSIVDKSILIPSIWAGPNPSNGIIYLNFKDEGEYRVEIWNMTGQMVYQSFGEHLSNSTQQISIRNANTGMYILHVKSNAGVFSQKLLIE